MPIGNGYQTYSDSTLKNLKKDTLIEYIRVLEENLRNAYKLLDNQAKILQDWEPVKHGRWDDSLDGITPYCTVCGRTHSCFKRTPSYCPNCGAKMDLDSEQAEA